MNEAAIVPEVFQHYNLYIVAMIILWRTGDSVMKFSKKRTKASIVLMAAILYICCGNISVVHAARSSDKSTDTDTIRTQDADKTFSGITFEGDTPYINEDFGTHLPLVVLDFPNIYSGIYTYADMDDIEPVEPLTMENTQLTLIEGNVLNRPDSPANQNFDIKIEELTYKDDVSRQKKDYIFQPLNQSQNNDGWLLLGGMYDKSLIRNYLGYTLAAEITGQERDIRFCELLEKRGERYIYQGVYLLAEGEKPESSVNITAGGESERYTFRNFGINDEESNIQSARQAINTIENVFSSADTNVFLQYNKIINTESFAQYFLLNEMMGNYCNIHSDSYVFDEATGMISPGYIMNFEGALDNEQKTVMNIRELRYQNAPFYMYLTEDSVFLDELINISKRNIDAEDSGRMNNLIDKGVAQIGEAQQRDWFRWNAVYFNEENYLYPYQPPDLSTINRERETRKKENKEIEKTYSKERRLYRNNFEVKIEVEEKVDLPVNTMLQIRQMDTYEKEIIKLKYTLNRRPAYVRKALLILRSRNDLLVETDEYRHNTILTVIAFLFLMGSIVFVRWRGVY